VRKVLLVALVALVAAALALPASAGLSGPARSSAQSKQAAHLQSANNEYVVAYADGASAAAAHAAIKAAGGTIVKENAHVGMATVKSSNAAFIAAAGNQSALAGAARNQPLGKLPSGAGSPRDAVEREGEAQAIARAAATAAKTSSAGPIPGQEPLADKQWGMRQIDATPNGSYRVSQGRRGVLVGIMDTGIDASHPDIAPNFNRRLSVNFTTDIPLVDGPCEVPSCVDPPDVDDNGHGTHVSGIVAAALNGLGVSGVAPKVQLVNIRAGQDSGFFFLQPTVDAMVYAGLVGIDVINMSFFTDPWLYNCLNNPADSPEEQAEQRTIRVLTQRAINFARAHGVTPVAALGNENTDLGHPTFDDTSPDFPPGAAKHRDVDNSCIVVPTETRGVISISALGQSLKKAHYSNWGLEQTDFSAPGGFSRDYFGTDQYNQPENRILSTYPLHVLQESGEVDPNGNPTTPFVLRDCQGGTCGYYRYLQGTSMASPHAAGVAALIVATHGHRDARHGGLTLGPRTVEQVLTRTAKQTPCPSPPIFTYPDPDLGAPYDAPCEGTLARNGIYGRGIVNALTAVID
jgi:lantibiotic leader peptide-processing serine protease